MFIRVRRNNTPVLLALSEIALVEPFDGGKKVSIKSTSGAWYFWDCTLDHAQDALIDNAAQVTAPIASRIMSLDNTVARLCRSMEDWLEKADTPILNADGMTPEEAERFKASMSETRATLQTIQGRLQSVPEKMLETDVEVVCQLLEDHEWAEHCTSTKLGQRLESAVTELHNEGSQSLRGEALAQEERAEKAESDLIGMRQRLERAEQLLAEVWHDWNNDEATRKAMGEDQGEEIGNFLHPMKKSACEKE